VSDKFQFTLNNITRSKPAEINEEFFVKVYGENGIKSEADMRANIKADLETYFDGRTDTLLINDIYKTIIENANFPLPETFLKRWIKLTNEKEISEEEIERDFPQFAKSLCWNLVQRKVVTENDIKITQEEVTERVRMQVIQQLYGYGLKNIGEEWVEQFIQKQLSDRKNVEQTREQLLEDKVLAYIKSKVKLNETPISFEAFKVMVEAQNA
jgi:trigger factor